MAKILVFYCSLIITSRHFYPGAAPFYEGQCVSGGKWSCRTSSLHLSPAAFPALWAWFMGSLQTYINRRMALLCVLLLSMTLLNGDCQEGFSKMSPLDCILQSASDLQRVVECTPTWCSRLQCIVTREGHSCIMYTLLHLLLIIANREGCPPPLILASFASI